MDENKFDLFKATDRERINEAMRMMDEWEKEEKEAADWDVEVDEGDQYVNLPEHTRKLLDCLGMLQGTLNTYEVKDDREKFEAIKKEISLIDFTEKYQSTMKKEWKILYHIREILEK